MNNPFKFGSIVDGDFFTDRREELLQIERMLNSDNHIILISPRRFGKSSLVQCAISKVSRPSIVLNLQSVVSETDFASRLLKQLFKLYPWEKVKHYMSHFRIVPTITTTPMTDQMEVSFMPSVSDASVVVEDVMQLLDTVSKPEKKLIIVSITLHHANPKEYQLCHFGQSRVYDGRDFRKEEITFLSFWTTDAPQQDSER